MDNVDHRGATTKLWSTVKGLSNTNTKTPRNTPIIFEDEPIHNTQEICYKFTQQFTPRPNKNKKENRAIVRKIKQLELKQVKISTKMVEDAIKSSKKSKALRPDNIAPIHSHFIAKQAIKYFSKLISFSLRNATLPEN